MTKPSFLVSFVSFVKKRVTKHHAGFSWASFVRCSFVRSSSFVVIRSHRQLSRGPPNGLLPYGERAIIVAVKKLKRAPTPAAAAPTTPRGADHVPGKCHPAIAGKVVVDCRTREWSLSRSRRLLAVARLVRSSGVAASFYWAADPPPFEQEALEAEQEAIRDSFGPVSESIAEDLARRQRESADDARAHNAIASEKARRGDQFERDLQAEHDAEVQELYQQEKQKPTKKGKS